jgi:tetratricopeptide (TPR) repeat protein
MLQSPVKPQLSAGAVHQHVFAYSLSENLTGMRRAIPEMEALARSHPTFGPFVPFARAEHARICGNYDEALARIEDALRMIVPGEHPLWPWVVGSRLTTLLALGRAEEAHALALRELAAASAVGLDVMKGHIEIPFALIEAKLGRYDSACERLDRLNNHRSAMNMQGVTLGWGYEARARVALSMGDGDSFEKNAQLCAQQYRKAGGDPSLAAKYERLMQDARNRGLLMHAELIDALAAADIDVDTTQPTAPAPSTAGSVYALSACISAGERADRALRLLIESSGAVDGALYLLDGDALKLAASSRAGLVSHDARAKLMGLVDSDCAIERAPSDRPTRTLHVPAPHSSEANVSHLVLRCLRNGRRAVAGVATLYFASGATPNLPFAIGSIAADLLINAGDVQPRMIADATPVVVADFPTNL